MSDLAKLLTDSCLPPASHPSRSFKPIFPAAPQDVATIIPAPMTSQLDGNQQQRSTQWQTFDNADKTRPETVIPEPSYRLSIRVPKLPRYQVDAVLNLIAAHVQPYKCGEFCGRCEIYMAYTRPCIPEPPECVETLKKREWQLNYLFKKLIQVIPMGLLQVWNSDCTESQDPPTDRQLDDRLKYRHYKWWTATSFFFPDDLGRFCDYEKIRLEIFDPTRQDSPEMASAGLPQERCQSSFCVKTQVSTIPNSGRDDSRKPASEKVKQRRFDIIGAELHEIMVESPSLTPTQVMKKLIGRAGAPNSCVVANDGDGVRWEDARGTKISLNQEMLNDRLRRWRTLNCPIKAPEGESPSNARN